MKYSYYSVKDNWEQARLISYLIAQTSSTKQLSVNDIVNFYWEKESDDESKEKVMTKEDLERLSKMADNYIKQIQLKEHGTN